MSKWIDVSEYQGRIEWSLIPDDIEGVVVRCIKKGVREDTFAVRNIEDALSKGLDVELYYIPYALSLTGMLAELQAVEQVAEKYGIKRIWIDFEVEENRKQIVFPQFGGSLGLYMAWLQGHTNVELGLYTNLSLYNTYGGKSLTCKLWIAAYRGSDTGLPKYFMWQYTSSGSITGIRGYVDMNKRVKEEGKNNVKKRVIYNTRPMMTGDDVVDVQNECVNTVYNFIIRFIFDGKAGKDTEKIIKMYQIVKGLKVDGKFGPECYKKGDFE